MTHNHIFPNITLVLVKHVELQLLYERCYTHKVYYYELLCPHVWFIQIRGPKICFFTQ